MEKKKKKKNERKGSSEILNFIFSHHTISFSNFQLFVSRFYLKKRVCVCVCVCVCV